MLETNENRYPDADVIVVEPSREDHHYFFSNIFSFESRCTVCNQAYQSTLAYLCNNQTVKNPTSFKKT